MSEFDRKKFLEEAFPGKVREADGTLIVEGDTAELVEAVKKFPRAIWSRFGDHRR